MAKEHDCNDNFTNIIDNPIGQSEDGKKTVFAKERRKWCSVCGSAQELEHLGTWEG